MRKIATWAGAAVTAAILASHGDASAADLQTTLPDVVVTAPAAPPPPARRFTPNVGIVRVEEDKWPEIPCAGARIASSIAGKCQEGPKIQNFQTFMPGGNVPRAAGECTIVHQLVSTEVGRFAVEADVLVFNPYKVTADRISDMCMVWSGYEDMPEDFKDMNQVARRGVGWHNFVPGNGRSGAQSTIEFSDGARGCMAVERLGPPWHGGFVWVLHATVCQPGQTAPIVPSDLDAAVGAIQIHVYDPVGNLLPPRT